MTNKVKIEQEIRVSESTLHYENIEIINKCVLLENKQSNQKI